MTKQQKINDWLDQTPIKNDLFGTQAMERRVIELEFALAVCLEMQSSSHHNAR